MANRGDSRVGRGDGNAGTTEVTVKVTDRARELAAQMYRQRPDRVSHIHFDPAALADAAERFYGRRPECQHDAHGWKLRFHFTNVTEAVHFKLKFS